MLEESHHYFNKAADLLDLSERVRKILITPRRVVKVEIVIESDSGQLLHFLGFRVQHSNTRGPYKGGLRYHPTLDESHAAALANLMTWKTAIADVPFGVARGESTATLRSSRSPNSIVSLVPSWGRSRR